MKKNNEVIGVITPYLRDFEMWKVDIGYKNYGDDAEFVRIRNLDDVRGREFKDIVKGYKYWEINEDIYNAAISRSRIRKQF